MFQMTKDSIQMQMGTILTKRETILMQRAIIQLTDIIQMQKGTIQMRMEIIPENGSDI